MDKQISRLIEQIAELARLSPFPDINLTVPVEVTLENHGVESDNTKAIQWISLSADLPTVLWPTPVCWLTSTVLFRA